MSKPRILVTGASGRLGTALIENHSQDFDFLPISGVDLSNNDITVSVISSCCPRLDGIITLAGGWKPEEEQTVEEMFKINFNTAFNAVGAALKSGLEHATAPRIVMIGAALALGTDQSPYARAKRGVHNFADTLVAALPERFKVNVIAPTTITDYDAVARQIVKYLDPSPNLVTGETFII